MKSYYRVMLGKGGCHASDCFEGGFIGTDFGVHGDLSGKLSDEWSALNRLFTSVIIKNQPVKTKIGAGRA